MVKFEATTEAAEILALQALEFIASDPRRLTIFLSLTGLSPQDVAASAGDRPFLAGVLDHLLTNESMLVEFCTLNNIRPEEPARAHARLIA
ncbi:MAG: DUF3572 domain-containing protein [Hyphomicrobiales bacterium]